MERPDESDEALDGKKVEGKRIRFLIMPSTNVPKLPSKVPQRVFAEDFEGTSSLCRREDGGGGGGVNEELKPLRYLKWGFEAFEGTLRVLRRMVLQRYFQVSPKLLGFGEACPGVLKVSCRGVALWASRNLATSVSMIWVCFKVT